MSVDTISRCEDNQKKLFSHKMTENYRHNLHEAHIIIVVGAGCRWSASRRFFVTLRMTAQNIITNYSLLILKILLSVRVVVAQALEEFWIAL
jgi:hypothetical protein